ncbi:hypothetical protein [Phenylobacterium sp.]|uniref:hypothetical protein n=1 Tax=Phenylobacterium sp. TaxID=1871053 RepID=UPI002ED8C951
MRRFLTAGAALLLLAGCATSPHKTVSSLNRGDPEYRTRDCRQARAAVARYDDNKDGRVAIAVAGNLVVPFAGSAVAAGMSKMKDDDREALNERVRRACVSDPLRGKRVARR